MVRTGPEVKILAWFLFFFLLSALSETCRAGQTCGGDDTRYLPLDHPLYDYLDRLQERGRLKKLDRSLRPYTRQEILEAVNAQETPGLRGFELEWLKIVRQQANLEPAGETARDSAEIAVITRIEASQKLSNIRPERSLSEIGIGFGGKFSHFVFDARFLRAPYQMGLRDTTSHRDPNVDPPFEEGLIRPMEGYLKGNFGLFGGAFSSEFFFGRMARNWSPALQQSLILGSDALSFDHLALILRSRHLVFSHLVAPLDGMTYRQPSGTRTVRAHRFFSAHRLDIRVRDDLRFGITETAVYGGENHGFDPVLMNPFTSFRLAAIQDKIDHANNTFVALDGYFNLEDRISFYGQFLFDDFLRDKHIQDRWACDLGATCRDIPLLGPTTAGLRATIVSSFAYNTFQPFERYLYYGRPLGASLGDDYWRIYGFLRYFLSCRTDLMAHLTRTARGAQRVAGPIQGLLNSGDLAFPTPPVEQRTEAGLTLRWQPADWAQLNLEGGFFVQRNMNNHYGTDRRRGYANLTLSFYRDVIVSF